MQLITQTQSNNVKKKESPNILYVRPTLLKPRLSWHEIPGAFFLRTLCISLGTDAHNCYVWHSLATSFARCRAVTLADTPERTDGAFDGGPF